MFLAPLLRPRHLFQPQGQEQRLVRGISSAKLPEHFRRGQRAPRLQEGAPEPPAHLLGLLPVFQSRLADGREGVRRQHLRPRAAVIRRGQFSAHALREVEGEGVVLFSGQEKILRVQAVQSLARMFRRYSRKLESEKT